MGNIIAVTNQKGGTGKTTTTFNLGAGLVKFHKRRVLLIDLDSQGSLTLFTGLLPEQIELHLVSSIKQPEIYIDTIRSLYLPKLKIMPSHPSIQSLAKSRSWLKWKDNFKLLLDNVRKEFDYVLIDCPPALDDLTIQVFCNCDGIIIPLQCEYMALRGVQLLLDTLKNTRKECNPRFKIIGILPTMYDKRTLHSKEVLNEITTALQGQVNIFPFVIPKSIRFPESAVLQTSIFEYDPGNPGSQAYKKLAKEIVNYG